MTDLITNTDLETSTYEFTDSPESSQGNLIALLSYPSEFECCKEYLPFIDFY